jgi:hypothetical protein
MEEMVGKVLRKLVVAGDLDYEFMEWINYLELEEGLKDFEKWLVWMF